MKTLACILHYNSVQYTEVIHKCLKPYEKQGNYDLIVLDNGSHKGKQFYGAEFTLDNNYFFGGGLNIIFQYVLDNPEYDSLLFLNSDLIVHGPNFVKILREELFKGYQIISPSVIEPHYDQCYWRTMHNWGSKNIREVPWIDFQCPMFNREFIEYVKQFDNQLKYGWGQDVLSGIICKDKDWKIGVLDCLSAVHLGGATIKDNSEMSDYNKNAEFHMWQYFNEIGKTQELIEMRNLAHNYEFNIS